jgi:hypothetical protein
MMMWRILVQITAPDDSPVASMGYTETMSALMAEIHHAADIWAAHRRIDIMEDHSVEQEDNW